MVKKFPEGNTHVENASGMATNTPNDEGTALFLSKDNGHNFKMLVDPVEVRLTPSRGKPDTLQIDSKGRNCFEHAISNLDNQGYDYEVREFIFSIKGEKRKHWCLQFSNKEDMAKVLEPLGRYYSEFDGRGTLGQIDVKACHSHSLSRAEENHLQLWHSIFKDETWLEYSIKEHRATPVLLSPHLGWHHSDTGSMRPAYMVLGVNDETGDLRRHTQKFFDSLHKHEFDRSRHEVTFPCGLVLNVFDIIRSQEAIEVDPTKLFQGKRAKHLKTRYSLWNDSDCMIRTVKSSDLRGPYDGRILQPVRRSDDPEFFCVVSIDTTHFAFCKAKDPKYWSNRDLAYPRQRMRSIAGTCCE